MISPAPPGTDPNNSICGECGGRFTMPRLRTEQDEQGYNVVIYALQCVENPEHRTYQSKNKGRTKMLAGPNGSKVEVDVATQQPVGELAPIKDHATALARTERASALEMFPTKNTPPAQLALIAEIALAYGVDPLFGEIMPYHGKPYITIKGRRRLDAANGNEVGITFRPPAEEEEKYWTRQGALSPGDVVTICIGSFPPPRMPVEGLGRVLFSDDTGSDFLPTTMRKIEMAEVRAERRMRERAFGPVAKPLGLEHIEVGEMEIDEANVVEGTATVIEEPPMPKPGAKSDLPDLGICPEHKVAWVVSADNFDKKSGNFRGAHKLGDDWKDPCRLATVYGSLLREAWERNTGGYVKSEVNTWLKDTFGGTWSKLTALDQVRAVERLNANQATGELDPPEDEEQDDLPEDEPTEEEMAANEAMTEH